jgi:hypothetical protein
MFIPPLPVSVDNVPHWLPVELWRHVFRLATAEENPHMYETEYIPFQSSGYWRSHSHTIALNLSRVSKQWQALAAEFLFRRVFVNHGAQGLLQSLKGSMESEGYGRYVRRLELHSMPVNRDTADPIRLLDILACCPRLQILDKRALSGRQGHEFWSGLIPASQPQTNRVLLTSLKRLDWSCSGDPEFQTPELSRFALAGLLFCSPNLRYLSVLWQPRPVAIPHTVHFSLTTLHLNEHMGLRQAGIHRGDAPNLIHVVCHPNNLVLDQDDSSVLVLGPQLRVVELLHTFGTISTVGTNFFKQCPNLQAFAYHVGSPQLQPLDVLQHLELKRVNLQIISFKFLLERYVGEGSLWEMLRQQLANFSAHTFPALEHIVLHGDWDPLTQDDRFRPLRQLVLDRGCLLEYPDGTPVH